MPRKNNTLSLDDDTESAKGKPAPAWETWLADIARQHPDFSCRENPTRDDVGCNFKQRRLFERIWQSCNRVHYDVWLQLSYWGKGSSHIFQRTSIKSTLHEGSLVEVELEAVKLDLGKSVYARCFFMALRPPFSSVGIAHIH